MAAGDSAPRLLPMAAVTILSATWAVSPLIAVKVEGSAVLLEPDSRVGIYARSPGQVQRLEHRVGDRLEQGDTVLVLDRIDQTSSGSGAVGTNPDALRRQGAAISLQKQAIREQIERLQTDNGPVGQQLKALEALRREEVIPLYSPLWVSAQVVPGQRLGTIGAGPQQRGRPRTAVALFSDADAARLRPGNTIELDVLLQSRNRYGGSAERWGLIEGRILRLSPSTADLAEVSRVVGDPELAANLMARSRQAAVGEGGDPIENSTDKLSAPVVLAVLELESADTPSGLRWSSGRGPDLPLENGTPAKVKVEVERRSALSFLAPFLRWLGGAER